MNPSINTLLSDHAKLSFALVQAQHAATQREQILLLIQADLRHYRLVHGLQQSGLITDDFNTHLGSVILPMMGFAMDHIHLEDEIVAHYISLLDARMELPLKEFLDQLPNVATKMYFELMFQFTNGPEIEEK